MPRKRGPRYDWKPVSARISPEMRDRINKKHPNEGDIQKLIFKLLERYLDGRILGININNNTVSN